MIKQILFLISHLITLGIFGWTTKRVISHFKLTKSFPVGDWGKRFKLMMEVAIGQTKIFRFWFVGFLHALVFWGFLVILVGSIEMIIDGLFGTDRSLSFLGIVYDIITASGDVFALIIAIAILIFLFRRIILNVKRFSGIEMEHKSHYDANIALTIILLLMLSLLGMNTYYLALHNGHTVGCFPVSQFLSQYIVGGSNVYFWHEFYWWTHILLIFLFANILPYSKHFHVFMSVPNVFLSRLEPLGYLYNMPEITKEVKLMMDPDAAFTEPAEGEEEVSRFGVKDVEDITW
ncbi:MAG: hypothetical protein K8R68_00240, partial [Bacteroidales bacterium]|nr:hypothetical protein [Bacteroidales bacterium]